MKKNRIIENTVVAATVLLIIVNISNILVQTLHLFKH